MMKNRKQFLWWITCLLMCIVAGCDQEDAPVGEVANQGSGYEYRPFVVEGKEWTSEEVTGKDGYMKYYIATYLIRGDAIVSGDSCKILLRKEEDGEFRFYCYLLERDRKVYGIHDDNRRWLVYDFGMTVGDMVSSTDFSATLEYVDTLRRGGELFRRLYLNIKYRGNKEEYNGESVWIEGIGSPCGPLMSFDWYLTDWYNSGTKICTLNGEIIFTSEDFDLPAWK